jgi:hypothetical protein
VTAELDWQVGLAPEIRMALYGYQAEFGGPPATLWRVPGTVTLLASGPLRLTVATPWGAVAAAGPGADGGLELARMERPGERERVPAAGPGSGARLLVRAELPDGSGAGAVPAVEQAIGRCLGDPAVRGAQAGAGAGAGLGAEHAAGHVVLGERRLPCDLAAAGLRLMLIDPRVRRGARPALAEGSPVKVAATALAAGDFAALGLLLTAAHEQQPRDGEQRAAVAAALRAGALGGRAVTDGPGRPVCLLVPADRVREVRAAVAGEFRRIGYRAPRFLTFTPGPGPDQPAAGNLPSVSRAASPVGSQLPGRPHFPSVRHGQTGHFGTESDPN